MGLRIDSTGTIELIGMEFHSFHGCLESEKKEGNTFLVDFCGKTSIRKAAKSDNLEDTPDYSEIYRIIASEMEKPSNLLENVAGRIVDAIVRQMPEFWFVEVRAAKKNPPVGGPCTWSRVTATHGSNLLPNCDPRNA